MSASVIISCSRSDRAYVERLVAHLAADGIPVRSHRTRVLARLGIAGRADLVDLLAGRDGGSGGQADGGARPHRGSPPGMGGPAGGGIRPGVGGPDRVANLGGVGDLGRVGDRGGVSDAGGVGDPGAEPDREGGDPDGGGGR